MTENYDPAATNFILAEAAYLVRTLGGTGARHHVALIGGLAPSLLIPSPLPDDPHVGTTDIDICLSVALTIANRMSTSRSQGPLDPPQHSPHPGSLQPAQEPVAIRLVAADAPLREQHLLDSAI